MTNNLDIIIEETRFKYPFGGLEKTTEINVEQLILCLLHEEKWQEEHLHWLSKIERKIDISNGLVSHYSSNWKKKGVEARKISNDFANILSLILYKNFVEHFENKSDSATLFKKVNTFLKYLASYPDTFFKDQGILQTEFENLVKDITLKLPNTLTHTPLKSSCLSNLTKATSTPKIIPITVLFSEGPIARAYLTTIHSLGLAPQKIVHLIAAKDVATKKNVGRFLPKAFKKQYAARIQQQKIHFWPKMIERKHPELKKAIHDAINNGFDFDAQTLKNSCDLHDLSFYCCNVDQILINDLKDPSLLQYITEETNNSFLFTGGGLVPPGLLTIPDKHFLHIHPGYLPLIRGADCLLWSSLIYGHASASCFYMAPGIDTGNIIVSEWMPKLNIDIQSNDYDTKTLYRAMYSYLDPWVRATVLRQILLNFDTFNDIKSELQKEEEGHTFHFMHENIQKNIFSMIFTKGVA